MEPDGMFPDSSFQRSFTSEEWKSPAHLIDPDAFLAPDPVFGCPYCADGGAEWIEIVYDDQTHKVTFDYLNAPEVVEPCIDSLRNCPASFE